MFCKVAADRRASCLSASLYSDNKSLVFSALINEEKLIILVDGNKEIPNFSLRQEAVIGGDGIVKSISAASIIAKVTRDRMMLEAHEIYPEYDFDRHKGYPTAAHAAAIREHGPCPIHRKSFRVPGA